MPLSNSQVVNQYRKDKLFEDIYARLQQKGVDMNNVTRKDISGVDEFHVRGAEVSDELVEEIYLKNATVLDVGCGLGGPVRMLAERFNCKVTGVDLCEDYIITAQKLSELVGLSDRTNFIHTDALDLPFEDSSFEVAWTQHVQMNIENKKNFYAEIDRVLMDGGALVYYDIFKKKDEEVTYPVPWANHASINFIESTRLMDTHLSDLGFEKLQLSDQTSKARQFLINSIEKMKTNGHPVLGLNLLMGNSTFLKLNNVLKAIEENKIELQSGIFKK
jgi:ubiquinone/menaquinone biosynthesis C-methylase UbiE